MRMSFFSVIISVFKKVRPLFSGCLCFWSLKALRQIFLALLYPVYHGDMYSQSRNFIAGIGYPTLPIFVEFAAFYLNPGKSFWLDGYGIARFLTVILVSMSTKGET